MSELKVVKVTVRTRRWSWCDRREANKATRVYVEDRRTADETILDQLVNRRSRPYNEYKPLVEKELRDAGYTGRIRWSQKAGCSMCPCSPGFVLDEKLGGEAVDVWVHVG